MRKMTAIVFSGILAAGMMTAASVNVFCQESLPEPVSAAEDAVSSVSVEEVMSYSGLMKTTVVFEHGNMTIRMESADEGADVPGGGDGFFWEYDRSDKGDASFVDLITQSDMEEGYDYVGCFRALPGSGTTTDTFRIIHTNGFVTDEYDEYEVQIVDDAITETIGGGHVYGIDADAVEKVLAGTWAEKDGERTMDIRRGDGRSFDVTVSLDGSPVREMTVFYDCVREAFFYRDEPRPSDESGESGVYDDGGAAGALVVELDESGTGIETITWDDFYDAADESVVFVRE